MQEFKHTQSDVLRFNSKTPQVKQPETSTMRMNQSTNRSNYDIPGEAKDFQVIIGSLKDILNNSHNYSRL